MTTVAAVRHLVENPDAHTVVAEVPLALCFVDSTYGRPRDPSRVAALVEHWHDGAEGVVYLSLRSDGRYAILDGAHRADAKRTVHGETASILARVYIDLTVEQEAALFVHFNKDRLQPTALDTFRARLAANEPVALRMHAVMHRAGISLAHSLGGRTARNTLVATSAVERAIRYVGEEHLFTVLTTLRDGFDGDSRGFSSTAITGMAQFTARYHALAEKPRVISKLQGLGVDQMLARARSLAAPLGVSIQTGWGQALRGEYNRNLRSGALPDWQGSVFPFGKRGYRFDFERD